MGGFGSGRWQIGKRTTSDYCQLDVCRLKREGYLEPGKKFNWYWKSGDQIIRTIQIHSEKNKIILSYKRRLNDNKWKDFNYPVWLDWTWCHFGNWRPWFLCPVKNCGKRAAILYGGAIFACRHCYQLAYPCQREDSIDRNARCTNKIRRRLGWKEGILNPPDGNKPKGMHWKTF